MGDHGRLLSGRSLRLGPTQVSRQLLRSLVLVSSHQRSTWLRRLQQNPELIVNGDQPSVRHSLWSSHGNSQQFAAIKRWNSTAQWNVQVKLEKSSELRIYKNSTHILFIFSSCEDLTDPNNVYEFLGVMVNAWAGGIQYYPVNKALCARFFPAF